MKVAFRTDASLQIGTGHVMRCLTLAEELKEKGAEVFFICRQFPGNLSEVIQQKGYQVFLLPIENELSERESWLGASWQQDAEETQRVLLKHSNLDWLVVDHYAIDERWEKQQQDVVNKILVIDDLADRVHSCDVLLDQNYYENMEARYLEKVSDKCLQLLGPGYSLLRKEFREARQNMRDRDACVNKIFVFFGGVDLHNMTGKVLESIVGLNLSDVLVDVVIGSTNPHRESIEALCSKEKNLALHIQVSNMAQMMADADLCVGSGGTVTWERCCLGLPTIAWSVAGNQTQLLKDSAKAGMVYVSDTDDPTVDEISCHLQSLLQNSLLRTHMSLKGLEKIDGRGAVRVVNRMLKPKIELRLANQNDVKKIYEWRNASDVRRYSHNSEIISFDQHKKWFENVLEDSGRYIFIGCLDGDEIGVLRFDVLGEQAEVSIYLAPEKHGQGYGAALIAAGENWLLSHCPEVSCVNAEVLPENKASNKLFEMCGYKLNAIQYQKSIS
jgi:UDP-2,4-diacetamido-2,4,6-trideoxy-beta-L-altropyranose hydrolase